MSLKLQLVDKLFTTKPFKFSGHINSTILELPQCNAVSKVLWISQDYTSKKKEVVDADVRPKNEQQDRLSIDNYIDDGRPCDYQDVNPFKKEMEDQIVEKKDK